MHFPLRQLDVTLVVQICTWISEVRGKGCKYIQDGHKDWIPSANASFISTPSSTQSSRSPFNLADAVAQHRIQSQPSDVQPARVCVHTKGHPRLPV